MASGNAEKAEGAPLPVRCALMSLVLPVDEIARLLLKGS